jgi:NAD(P)H-hydrate repair Nnr-like enzyme with NAD(P)H-hydrate epimerase domain
MESRGIGRAQTAAISGVQRASKLMEKAAAQVANVALERQAIDTGPAASVNISPQARALAGGGGDPTADIAEGFVHQSLAKHLNAANVKVLQTTDDTLKELTRRR